MTTPQGQGSNDQPGALTRRTILKGAAWSVPVIAVGSAVPAMAATCVPTLTLGPDSCKCPGQSTADAWTYYLEICAGGTSCPQGAFTAVVTRIVSNSNVTIYTGPSPSFVTGQCIDLTGQSTNSANFLDIYYKIDGGPEMSVTVDSPPKCDDVPGLTDCAER